MSYVIKYTNNTLTFYVQPHAGRDRYRIFWRPVSTTEAQEANYYQTTGFSHTATGLTPGTDYLCVVYAYTQQADGTSSPDYDNMGITYFTTPTTAKTTWAWTGTRPSNFVWESTFVKGLSVPTYLGSLAPTTAVEWTNLCAWINAFRTYKGLSAYSFTGVSRGAKMSSVIINQALTAIRAISGHGTMPTTVYTNSAAFWTQLAAALNAIS